MSSLATDLASMRKFLLLLIRAQFYTLNCYVNVSVTQRNIWINPRKNKVFLRLLCCACGHQAQLVRRVRDYLVSLKVIENESTLSQMSLACEPPPGSAIVLVM